MVTTCQNWFCSTLVLENKVLSEFGKHLSVMDKNNTGEERIIGNPKARPRVGTIIALNK